MRALSTQANSFIRIIDEAECYEQLRRLRWPDGQVRCPYCGGQCITKSWPYFRQPACRRYECGACRVSFNDKTATIFEETKLPLAAWFLGFYLAQLGQSTATIAREVPCAYRTAQRMVWLVRAEVVRLEGGRLLQGTVEVDEIYVTAGHKGQAQGGGRKALAFPPRRRGKKRGRGRGSAAKDTPAIVAMVGREQGQVVLAVVPDVSRTRLEPIITRTIAPGSTVYTDSAGCYAFLSQLGYLHETVNHSQGEYARGAVHENHAETIWSLFLPWLAPFRGVSQDNLPSYVTFFQFLFNHRHLHAFARAQLVLQRLLARQADLFLQCHQWLRQAVHSLAVHPIPI